MEPYTHLTLHSQKHGDCKTSAVVHGRIFARIRQRKFNGRSFDLSDQYNSAGAYVDLSVNLTAPATAGSYRGYWRIRNAASAIDPDSGGYNSQSFYVDIQVSGGGAFAVTHVSYTLSTFNDGSYTGCPIVTAHITTNAVGDVQYHWVRSDGSESVQTLHFGSATTQNVSEKWYLGSTASGTYWLGIYVDSQTTRALGTLI